MTAAVGSPVGLEYESTFTQLAVDSSLAAGRALTTWLGRDVRLHTDGFERAGLAELGEVAGPAEEAVVAVHMPLEGDLGGDVLLALPESVAMMLVDLLTGRGVGATTELGELECSCIQETGNIVGSSFANCLARWLRLNVIPGAPSVRYDLACAVVEPLLSSEAALHDEIWLTKTRFHLGGQELDWRMVLLLADRSLARIRDHCQREQIVHYELDQLLHYSASVATSRVRQSFGREIQINSGDFARTAFSDVPKAWDDGETITVLEGVFTQHPRSELIVISRSADLETFARRAKVEAADNPTEHDNVGRALLEATISALRETFATRLTPHGATADGGTLCWTTSAPEPVTAQRFDPARGADFELFRSDLLIKLDRAGVEATAYLLLENDGYAQLGKFPE